VNCSLIFSELPLLERPAAARAAGFDAIEFWWPWTMPVPPDPEVEAFEAAIRDAGVQLIGLNFFAGDLAGPDCGVASLPERADEFRANVDVVAAIGRDLGVRRFNALFGNRVETSTPDVQDDVGVESLASAARALAAIDGVVMVEAVSGPKPYPLRTAADAMSIVERVRVEGALENVGFLADFFHLSNNGEDVDDVIDRYGSEFAHLQIADAPGRHEPGSGSLDLAGLVARARAKGYDGWVGLEYVPSVASSDSFAWLLLDEWSIGSR
jgi:hydroxypyruvate isomerase